MKQNLLNYKIEMLSVEQVVKVVHLGPVDDRSLNAAAHEASVILKAIGWQRILSDLRQAEVFLLHTDLFMIVDKLMKWHPPQTKIATLTHEDSLSEERNYSAKVAEVNQFLLKHFFDEDAALGWLRA